MNVVFLSFNDWGGTAYHYAQAYKKFGNAFHVVYHNVSRNHPREICIATDGPDKAIEVISKADILHFVGDEPIKNPWKWPQSSIAIDLPNVPKVITVIGSYFRRSNISSISCPICSKDEIKANTNLRTYLTPDLNYDWFDSTYLPFAFDVFSTNITWKNPLSKVIVGHSPTVREKKGTSIIVDAISNMQNIELDIIENVTWSECMERKSKCHLFIEDLVSGVLGYSAIEAMSLGIPTISYLNTDYNTIENPVISCFPNKESVIDAINLALSKDLDSLSKQNRIFAERNHSYEYIGVKLNDLYKMLI